MKREYFAPKAELCEVQTIQMVAGSSNPVDDGKVEPGKTGVMSRDRQGDWNNIWGN